jgi:hypothetical protein
MNQTQITDRLKETYNTNDLTGADVLSRKVALFTAMLQQLGGVDEVLIFDEAIFDVDTFNALGAVVKLPDPSEDSQMLDPTYGKSIVMIPDDGTMYEIESNYNENEKCNDYDCTTFIDIKEFNAGAKYLVSGLATP